MNERQAIEFILEEIKEQRRADFDMYFEMRKQTTAQYERFLDRLRELDELDRELNAVSPREYVEDVPPPTYVPTVPYIHTLPEPRFKGTKEELRVDRIEDEHEKKRYIDIEKEVAPLVIEYMMHADGSEPLRNIQYYVESELGQSWVNFSVVMSRIMDNEPRIQRSKVRGYYIWRDAE